MALWRLNGCQGPSCSYGCSGFIDAVINRIERADEGPYRVDAVVFRE